MCLAVPGRIESIRDERGTRYGRVDFGGVSREVCLEFVPEAAVGDWALVHVGFALARLDEAAARATFEALAAAGLVVEEAEASIDHADGAGERGGRDGAGCPLLPRVAPATDAPGPVSGSVSGSGSKPRPGPGETAP